MRKESQWKRSTIPYYSGHTFNINITAPLVANALQVIGNTPVIHLCRLVPGNHGDFYLKLESFNPIDSYKDRMANY